ncbi:DUF4179 domain-containing protein [Paenibacillus solani]|uniref:DUF4179 domain-containing protein n=1 Tax=Paenibacillus solani TaxID=1705565 RepID=UPI003D27A0AB
MIEKQIQNARRPYESMNTDVNHLMERVQQRVGGKDVKSNDHRNHLRRVFRGLSLTFAGTVMILAVIIVSGFVSPAMASVLKELPYFGSIFQNDVSTYVKDIGLNKASEQGMSAQIGQSASDKGITLEIQELIYDGDRLSIGYLQHSENHFTVFESPMDDIEFTIDDKPYNDSISGNGPQPLDSRNGIGLIHLEPLKQKLPDEFVLTIEVGTVGGIKGNWDFSIPVKKTVTGIKTVTPMISSSNGETSMLLKQISFKPGVMNMEYEFRRAASKAGDPMYDVIAITDTGEVLKQFGGKGNGYVEGDTHIQYWSGHFDEPKVMPKSITLLPHLAGEIPVYGKRVPMKYEPSTDHPFIIPQGELGSLLVTKVERLEEVTLIHYRKEGNDPLQQTELIVEDTESKYHFTPWEGITIIPQEEIKTKLVDAKTKSYIAELPAQTLDQSLIFITHEYKQPLFLKELELVIPIQ